MKKNIKSILLVVLMQLPIQGFSAEPEKEKKEDEGNTPKITIMKEGFGVKHMLSGTQYQIAARGAEYIKDSPFHIGAELMYQGSYVATNGNAVSAMLLFGLEKAMKPLLLGGSLGLGAGFFNNAPGIPNAAMSFLMQPEAYFGFVLGGGYRLVASAGYTSYVTQNSFSGATIGIRFDYKTQTTVVGLDD